MARTTNLQGGRRDGPNPLKVAVEVENAEEIFEGALTSARDAANATAANRGRLGALTGAAGQVFVGEALPIQDPNVSESDGDYTFNGKVTGDTSATIPPRAGQNVERRILKKQTVTGVSSIADQWKPVFASDDDTFTLTASVRPEVIAFITKRHADDTCDLWMLPLDARFAQCVVEQLRINVNPVALDGGAGNVITSYLMPFKGMIIGLSYEVVVAATGSPANVINMELGTVDVTGGSLTIDTGAAGTYTAYATAATANHYFHRGKRLDLESDAGTAGGGSPTGCFILDVIRLPGS